ncbi:MAG: hypothetical protein GXY41_08675 [Phycisphaerae bacterium]|nr:hypothetical protein [Phycisphaerae bacterium]
MEITKGIKVHFTHANRGRKQIKAGPAPVVDTPEGRVPRLSRLMALAIHFDNLIRQGGICNQADLAQLGHVSRARVTQIMNLLYLAPDIQEHILFLPPVTEGRDPVPETKLRKLVKETCWEKQRQMWERISQ